jgi:hypothetical protein
MVRLMLKNGSEELFLGNRLKLRESCAYFRENYRSPYSKFLIALPIQERCSKRLSHFLFKKGDRIKVRQRRAESPPSHLRCPDLGG